MQKWSTYFIIFLIMIIVIYIIIKYLNEDIEFHGDRIQPKRIVSSGQLKPVTPENEPLQHLNFDEICKEVGDILNMDFMLQLQAQVHILNSAKNPQSDDVIFVQKQLQADLQRDYQMQIEDFQKLLIVVVDGDLQLQGKYDLNINYDKFQIYHLSNILGMYKPVQIQIQFQKYIQWVYNQLLKMKNRYLQNFNNNSSMQDNYAKSNQNTTSNKIVQYHYPHNIYKYYDISIHLQQFYVEHDGNPSKLIVVDGSDGQQYYPQYHIFKIDYYRQSDFIHQILKQLSNQMSVILFQQTSNNLPLFFQTQSLTQFFKTLQGGIGNEFTIRTQYQFMKIDQFNQLYNEKIKEYKTNDIQLIVKIIQEFLKCGAQHFYIKIQISSRNFLIYLHQQYPEWCIEEDKLLLNQLISNQKYFEIQDLKSYINNKIQGIPESITIFGAISQFQGYFQENELEEMFLELMKKYSESCINYQCLLQTLIQDIFKKLDPVSVKFLASYFNKNFDLNHAVQFQKVDTGDEVRISDSQYNFNNLIQIIILDFLKTQTKDYYKSKMETIRYEQNILITYLLMYKYQDLSSTQKNNIMYTIPNILDSFKYRSSQLMPIKRTDYQDEIQELCTKMQTKNPYASIVYQTFQKMFTRNNNYDLQFIQIVDIQ